MNAWLVSTGADSAHGIIIRWCTAPGLFTLAPYNHTLVAFGKGEYPEWYYESYWKKFKTVVDGKEIETTGVRGPIDYLDLLNWQNECKSSRRIHISQFPYTSEECERVEKWCRGQVGRVKYASYQLLQNASANLFRLSSAGSRISRKSATCSEFGCLTWYQFNPRHCAQYALRGGYITHDMSAPSGDRYGLSEAFELFKKDLTGIVESASIRALTT